MVLCASVERVRGEEELLSYRSEADGPSKNGKCFYVPVLLPCVKDFRNAWVRSSVGL
jgi:hypothetical protein